jgi:hypothetical protein
MSLDAIRAVQAITGLATLSLFTTVLAIGAANASAVRQHGLACVKHPCTPKLATAPPGIGRMAALY